MLKKDLKAGIRDLFTEKVRNRGLSYYMNSEVKNIQYEENVISADVLGSGPNIYEVEIYFHENGFVEQMNCDCLYDENCKHQAAVLYEAVERYSRLVDVTNMNWSVPSLSDQKKVLSIANIKPSGNKVLKSKKAGEYRLLPIENGELSKAIKSYQQERPRGLQWTEAFKGEFINSKELEIKIVENNYSTYDYEEEVIRLKREEDGIYVKCEVCNAQTNKLCSHQVNVLSAAAGSIKLSGFLQDSTSYDDIEKKIIEATGVTKEALGNYFGIMLGVRDIDVKILSPNVKTKSWFTSVLSTIVKKQQIDRQRLENLEETLRQGREFKTGIIWMNNYNDEYGNLSISFLTGPGLKRKVGFQWSNLKFFEKPRVLPAELQEVANNILNHHNTDDPQKFKLITEEIENNIEPLNTVYNYVYAGDDNYGKPSSSKSHLVQFHPSRLECSFVFQKKDGMIQIHRNLTVDSEKFDYSKVIYSNKYFCATNSHIYLYANEHFEMGDKLFSDLDTIIVPIGVEDNYTQLIADMRKNFEVEVEPGIMKDEEILLKPEFQILLREVGTYVLFEPRLKFGEYSFNAFDEESYSIQEKLYRPLEEDRLFLENFLKSTHPNFQVQFIVQEYVFLNFKEVLTDNWFFDFFQSCNDAGVEVLGQKDLTKFNYSHHRAVSFSHVKSGIDWFDVDMGVSFGKEKVKMADWVRAIRNKESFVTLKDGTLGVLPKEWIKQARQILSVAEVEKGELKISKYRFNVIEDLFSKIDDKKLIKEIKEKKKRLENIDTEKKHKVPGILKAKLRNYQKHGFAWLKFLDESGFGGILADDMGLGKTVQVIALLADQMKKEPSLVIVPRSLLFNWGEEIDKFCPKLSYVIHHGSGRNTTIEELVQNNVIITTYGTAASDIELLQKFKFNYIILDESQAIKNAGSKRYKAMRLLQSENKIAMTGTPIENNTMDLYAQLSFTSPGLFGSQKSFKDNFAVPIDNNSDLEAAALLRKLIHPFVLRRTKDQVAKDLPEKTETVIYCEMGPTQRKLYENLKRKIKEDLDEAIEEKGFNKSKFQMLDGLLRLRQMCNSPRLVNKSFKGANAESVKIEMLMHNLTEELDKHSALVFSQFVSLLSLVREELDARGIKYAYLDGSTTKRKEEVKKFMEQEDIQIFLISIKAGNTGLNLTKADYVYILDPWWNPAVEAQAIDRTHRIGQDQHIFAYKLICKDSIEEKILKLQQKKKQLAEDIIQVDEHILKSLQKSDLMSLFE